MKRGAIGEQEAGIGIILNPLRQSLMYYALYFSSFFLWASCAMFLKWFLHHYDTDFDINNSYSKIILMYIYILKS